MELGAFRSHNYNLDKGINRIAINSADIFHATITEDNTEPTRFKDQTSLLTIYDAKKEALLTIYNASFLPLEYNLSIVIDEYNYNWLILAVIIFMFALIGIILIIVFI